MKVQCLAKKITLAVLIIFSLGAREVSAQMEENVSGIIFMSSMFGGLLPAGPILLDMGAVWGLVSVSSGVGILYVGLVNESTFASYMGTSFVLGGTYLLLNSDHKPTTQLLGNYGIWVLTGIAFAGTDAFTEGNFQPYITPTGAGFRYRF